MTIATRIAPLAVVLLAGCFEGPALDAAPDKLGASADGSAEGGTTTTSSAGAGAASGLPCDVDALFATHCRACHSSPPVNGAPMPLITYDDLVAPAKSDPTKKVADVSLARIQNDASPMPPAPNPRVSAAEIATLSSWVQASEPQGTCGGSDAGAATSSTPPPSTPLVCTSGTYWTGGDKGSNVMHPGGACITCHAQSGDDAPRFTIGGTVFPTFREPTDCNGFGGGATVVITGADGASVQLQANNAGNFFTTQPIATPYRAKVVVGGVERAMPVTQTSGDCNSCHTQDGANGAPGRVVKP